MSIYLTRHELKVGMLVRTAGLLSSQSPARIVMILSDQKGICQDGYILVADLHTGKPHQQLAHYLRPLKT
jgi:hypothetical protein